MDKIISFLSGRKSYIVAALAIVGAILLKYGIVAEIPAWIWPLLAGLGLGTVRMAISKIQSALDPEDDE